MKKGLHQPTFDKSPESLSNILGIPAPPPEGQLKGLQLLSKIGHLAHLADHCPISDERQAAKLQKSALEPALEEHPIERADTTWMLARVAELSRSKKKWGRPATPQEYDPVYYY